jgi:hypothetical protein
MEGLDINHGMHQMVELEELRMEHSKHCTGIKVEEDSITSSQAKKKTVDP